MVRELNLRCTQDEQGAALKTLVEDRLVVQLIKDRRNNPAFGETAVERVHHMTELIADTFTFTGPQLGSGSSDKAINHSAQVLDAILDGLAPSTESRNALMQRWITKHEDEWEAIVPEKVCLKS